MGKCLLLLNISPHNLFPC